MSEVRFDGVEMRLGNKAYIVPPLSLKKVRALQPRIEKLDISAMGALSPEALETVVEMAHAALARNYPEITLAEVEELLDLGNIGEVMKVILGQNKFTEKKTETETAASP